MVPRVTSSKLIALGTVVASVAAAVAVAIGQAGHRHGLPSVATFWIAIGVVLVGALVIVAGVWNRDGEAAPPAQSQVAGNDAIQYQAGRDINPPRRTDTDRR